MRRGRVQSRRLLKLVPNSCSTIQFKYKTNSLIAPAPPTKSSFGGLRRLGTVLGGRSSKGAKAMDGAPSPEKRSRQMKNPLRRGTSSHHNMEIIPSPPLSSSNLPQLPPLQQEAPSTQPTSSQPTQIPQLQERRLSNDQVNGDRIQPAPTRGSSLAGMTNGTSSSANHDLATVQEAQAIPPPGPPPGKMAEVSDSCHRGLVLC